MVVAVALAMPLVSASTVTADGEPVPGFGVNGVVVEGDLPYPGLIADVAQAPDGSIVAVGTYAYNPSPTTYTSRGFVIKYQADGQRDPTFGHNGLLETSPDLLSNANAVAVFPDGRIVVGGYLPQGVMIIGSTGKSSMRVGGGFPSQTVTRLLPLPTGAFVYVGWSFGTEAVSLVQPNGFVDETFQANVRRNASLLGPEIPDAALDSDGFIVVAVERNQECRAVRLDQSGEIDTTFGTDGVADPALPKTTGSCNIATLPNRGVVLSAQTSSGPVLRTYGAGGQFMDDRLLPASTTDFDITGSGRLLFAAAGGVSAEFADGTPDTSFATSGFAPFTGWDPHVKALAAGNIAVWGQTTIGRPLPVTVPSVQILSSPTGVAPEPPAVESSRFVPVPPERLLDTRVGLGAPAAKLGAGGQIDLQVAGAGGVPNTDISAVVLNVTATDATQAGFVTAYPAGERRPNSSSLNVGSPGETAANLVTVKVGGNGKVTLFSSGGTHLVADVAGYYTPTFTSTAGRLQTAAPQRILDTREGLGAVKAKLPAGGQIDLQVTGAGPVPSSGISAVVLNVTADQATANGYVTVWPTGPERPVVSNLNLTTGETRPNLVIVPVGAGGKVSLFTQSGAELIADVAGWFTDSTAPEDSVGLFVPITPTRMLDTRDFIRAFAPVPGVTSPLATLPTAPGSELAWRIGSTNFVPPNRTVAIAANITVTQATGAGFVTAWPAHTNRPTVSNLNATAPGQTIPNAAIVPLGEDDLALYTQSGTHLIVDINGWYTNF
jgi:uncharacterized delta-60 repeat protein